MSERDEQIKLVRWLKAHSATSRYTIALLNEGKRSPQLGAIYKKMGLRPGASDIFLALPKGKYHGFWIELKFGTNKATPAQLQFLNDMRSVGYKGEVIWGYEEAVRQIEEYLSY